MAIKVTLNGVEKSYKPGITITEKLTEDLDTGVIIFPQTTELTIEPMDTVIIYDYDVTPTWIKAMKVSDIKRTTSKYTGTKEYNYFTGLVSPTIQLQRIVLPNRSVTQPLTVTKISIYTVLSRYVAMYSDFTISTALQTLTTGVDCPEFQWNRPTLFEVCNDLLSEVDAVITFTAGSTTSLNYLSLNTDGDEITGAFTDIEETQNITDYADKIECEAENAVIKSINTRVVEWLITKTEDEAILTETNAKIILEKNIYKINKFLCKIQISSHSTTPIELDLTDYLVEKKIYDLYLPSNTPGLITGSGYKRNALYYEEGSNIIDGLTYREDTWIPMLSSKVALINIFVNAYIASGGPSIYDTLSNDEVLDFAFKVDYQAIETVKFVSNKENPTKNASTLINNQDTSYVDFGAFARKQQNTVNRLGNSTLTLTKKYFSYASMPTLGDYYDTDYKLAMREFTLDDNFINFKGTLSKNYILKDIFTGIKSERRFTSIATESEALESNHIEEVTLNLSGANATTNAALENYFLQLGKTGKNIKIVHFKTNESVDLGIAPSLYYSDKNFTLTYKMTDNFSAGATINTVYKTFTTEYNVNYQPYVDSADGTFTTMQYKLYQSYTIPLLNLTTAYEPTNWRDGKEESRKLPRIDTTQLNDLVYDSGSLYRYKDNREITVETIQFNFTTDSVLFIGKKFFENNAISNVASADTTLFVAYSTTLTYEKGDQTKKGTVMPIANLTFTVTTNKIQISSPDSSVDLNSFASWCICDILGNLYLANNGNDTTIYLNKE